MHALEHKQHFMSSHNRMVVDFMTFDSSLDLQAKIHFVERNEDGLISLIKLSDEKSAEIFNMIQTQIVSPSAVLLNSELW